MADLTTRANVKRALGVPDAVTQHDAYIDILLEVADKTCISYCGMAALTQTTVTEEAYDIPTTWENEFTLRNFPVTAVTAVLVGGTTLTTDSWFFEERSGTIKLKNYGTFFEQGRQQVEVSYTYGYATVPADLAYAATLICISHFNKGRHAGITSEAMGSYRYSIDRDPIPASARAILANYTRIFPKESV